MSTLRIELPQTTLERTWFEKRLEEAGLEDAVGKTEISQSEADAFLRGGFDAFKAAAASSGEKGVFDRTDPDRLKLRRGFFGRLGELMGRPDDRQPKANKTVSLAAAALSRASNSIRIVNQAPDEGSARRMVEDLNAAAQSFDEAMAVLGRADSQHVQHFRQWLTAFDDTFREGHFRVTELEASGRMAVEVRAFMNRLPHLLREIPRLLDRPALGFAISET
jgi:hypothetical protein